MKNIELRTDLKRSAIFASWWVLHFFLASMLLQFALGAFVNGDSISGVFEPASMAQVMKYLSLPLAPTLAFGLLFLTLAGLAYVVAWLWRRILRATNATEADTLTAEGLRWAIRQQLLTAWLLAPLVLTGLAWWAVHQQYPAAAIGLVILITYGLPVLILRPRWLGLASGDRSWLPSYAALGVYLVAVFLFLGVGSVLVDRDSPAALILALLMYWVVDWLSASVLIFVRSRHEVVPHLAARLNGGFALFAALALARPLRLFALWILPSILLLSFFALFIAPTVTHVSPKLPDFAVAAHILLIRVTEVFASYWWMGFFSTISTAVALYMGRCLVLFDARERAESTRIE